MKGAQPEKPSTKETIEIRETTERVSENVTEKVLEAPIKSGTSEGSKTEGRYRASKEGGSSEALTDSNTVVKDEPRRLRMKEPETKETPSLFTAWNIGIAFIFIALLVIGVVWLVSYLKKSKKSETKQHDFFDLEGKGKDKSVPMSTEIPFQTKMPFKN